MEYTISRNDAFNSLEISFDGKPSEAIREALKGLRFRWHNVKKVWYGYTDEATVRAAIDGKEAAPDAKPEAPAPKIVNKFGVKVGDIFHMSWGYEQTNNDFFQVVALVGKESVRVRQVNPLCLKSEAVSSMSEDRVFCTNTNGELLPPCSSIFIKDQEKGDLKRLKSFAKDGVSNPQFYVTSYADAHYCGSDTIKVYESWYA